MAADTGGGPIYGLGGGLNWDAGFQQQKPNQPYILDLVTLERLVFQSIPVEIDINPEAQWAVINAAGRNNPLYQYTGGEDTIEFSLSWYANVPNKQDVINKCKWLESLCRNNGYDEPPHRVKFVFGELFQQSTFLVHGAPYKISNFDRSQGMMPCLAIQQVSLKRIQESNRKRKDILNIRT